MCGLAMALPFPPAGFQLGDFGENSEISLTEMTSQQRVCSLVVKATGFQTRLQPFTPGPGLGRAPGIESVSQLPVLL